MKLLNTFIALALALCATLAHPADADPPGVAGRLNYITGPVSFAPAQAKDDWSVAELNRPITTGDRLWTDTGGRAEMRVGSLAVRMDAQTSLDVLALDDRRIQLRLAQGTMNMRVRRLSSDKLLEVATPGGAVVIKQPGTYRVSVDPSGMPTVVTVRGSQAEVFTGKSSFLVRTNQQATISGERQNLVAAPPPDEFDRWAAARDQRDNRVTSTRYVSEEMTGYEDLDEHGRWETAGEYGPVWYPAAVPAGWAPYRHGRWVWVAPWGWTWVDRAPWGFAPFHYGRWVHYRDRWAWAPGRRVLRPVYAPALVGFIGGPNWSVSIGAGSGLAVGWVPLGWREPYRPWYRASPAHFRNVNVTHVTNVTNITNVRNITYRNRAAGATVVSRENFVAARAADKAALQVNAKTLASAPVARGTPVEAPARASLAASERGKAPPSAVRARETVTVNPPPGSAREARKDKQEARAAAAGNDDSPRVRVVDRAKRVELKSSEEQATSAEKTPKAAKSQGAGTADSSKSERAQEKSRSQAADSNKSERAQERSQSQADTKKSERAQEKAASRAPAPPPDVSQRQTFDREKRQSGSKDEAEAKREQRQTERQERREKASTAAPQAPAAASERREEASQRAQQRAREQAQEQQAQQQRQRERAATQKPQESQAQEPPRRRQPEAQQQQQKDAQRERRQERREQREREQRQRGD